MSYNPRPGLTRRKTKRVSDARELVIEWFKTNNGTAMQAHRALGIVGRSTIDNVILYMRAQGLPQAANVIAKTRRPPRKLDADRIDDCSQPTKYMVESALQRRSALELAWCGAA
jgi:hypothetical protein